MNSCKSCLQTFGDENTHKSQIYCSTKCNANASHRRKKGLPLRLNVLVCAVCDRKFNQKRINNTEYCTLKCKKLAASRRHKGISINGPCMTAPWGSGYKTSNGYKMISKNHPNAKCRSPKTGKGQVMEHVWVMSERIGRPLNKKETVHHRNGIRDDNRLENLELWSSSHPPGQRVEDKIHWCKEFLEQYGLKVISSD